MSSDAETLPRPFQELLEELESRGRGAYAVDGLTPRHAVRPRAVSELQEIVRSARAEGLAIIPWGGGSQMGFGNVPERYDIAVDLTGLDQVLRYDPDDMTMSVQAGCRLGELNRMLGEHRQVLPVDAADPDRATIGGLAAVGMSGPRRLGYGPLRDLIIGMTIVTADGTLATAGGQVVKNVTGYDMMRLHHGALGSLGIILSLNLKVIPKPQSERTAMATYDTLEQADAAARTIAGSQLDVTAIVVTNPVAASAIDGAPVEHWQLAVRCEAPPSAVVRQAERVLEHIGEGANSVHVQDSSSDSEQYWQRACQALDHGPDKDDLAFRIGAATSRLGSVGSGLLAQTFAAEMRLTLDYGSGLAYVRLPGAALSAESGKTLAETITGFGDHASLLTAPTSTKRQVDVYGGPVAGFSMMESLKATFDPDRIFNPGRYMGRL